MGVGTDTVVGLVDSAPTKKILIEKIERLNISADAKAILSDVAAVTIDVGGRLVQVGRRVIAFILDLVRQYPNTTFGVIAALVVSALIASVPLLGAVLSPLLAPLLLAFGIAKGALADMAESSLNAKIGRMVAEFGALNPAK